MCGHLKDDVTGADCSGHGSCDAKVTGQCTCQSGFRGADCSKSVTALTNKLNTVIKFNGTQSYYMQYDAGVFAG